MTQTTQPTRVSSFELEQYVVGELHGEARARLEAQIAADPRLARRVQERLAECRAFTVDPRRRPFEQLAQAAKVRPAHSGWWNGWMAIAGAAAACLLALTLSPTATAPESRPAVATRGGLAAKAAVLRGTQSQFLASGDSLLPGDRLALTVDDPLGGWVTVLLQEDSGRISVPYPPEELGPVSPGTHLLPGSLELDARMGEERLYILVSEARPDVSVWVEELQRSYEEQGWHHDWLPPRGTRMAVLQYRKVAP